MWKNRGHKLTGEAEGILGALAGFFCGWRGGESSLRFY